MTTASNRNLTFQAIFLVSGCCIGAGMIGLPVVSALAGFLPTTVAMIICYLFATSTGLLLLEATLWFQKRVNLISMVEFSHGKVLKGLTWSLFLFLFYCIFVAYIDGGGQLVVELVTRASSFTLPKIVGIFTCVLLVGFLAYCGTKTVSFVGRILFFGIVVVFLSLLVLGLPAITPSKLLIKHWEGIFATLPILLICFGYQNLVPTLTYFTNRNVRVMKIAILVGNLVPFVIYGVWNMVILGLMPLGEFNASNGNTLVTELLINASGSGHILLLVQIFSILAILMPFMANTITFVDFLKDGIKPLQHKSSCYALVLILLPPTVISLLYPKLFLQALSIAGGFADVLLFGILPVLIIWKGRYHKDMKGQEILPGGKVSLALIFLFSLGMLSLRFTGY